MNLLFDIVRHSENITANSKGRMEKKDSSKYLIANIGIFSRIRPQDMVLILIGHY
uniref:Uncharacterized protein n=1 Tax=Rhizophagus irregularis (strain DAOM 181602 / DAOM 197198 / MUCL 43194) TaxID=747089 RepID=U9SPE4_RHIID